MLNLLHAIKRVQSGSRPAHSLFVHVRQHTGMGTLTIILMLLMSTLVATRLGAVEGSAERAMNDANITRAIEADLWIDEGVSPHLLDVTTLNGIVTLAGSVESLLAEERAVRIARSILGVRAVVNEISVRPVARADAEIEAGIVNAWRRNPATDSYELTVSAQKGVATLSGQVDSWQEKQLAALVAKSVAGVRALSNDIVWQWTPGRTDMELRADIQEGLAWDLWLDERQIDVQVEDGKVTLSGSVGSAIEKTYAVSDAWVAGVKEVNDSQLEVVPSFKDPNRKPGRYVLKADEEIQRAVEAALEIDPRVRTDRLVVGVADGVVTLTGVVEGLQASQSAEQDAGNTVGVVRVDNRLKVRPARALSDAEIAESIREALRSSPWLDGQEGIRVRVVNQKAYLSGSVDSDFKRRRAANLAAAVRGVVAIENNLVNIWTRIHSYRPGLVPIWDYYSDARPRAIGHVGPTAGSDSLIQSRIEDQLFWSPFVDSDDIEVRVTNGVATLFGTVDSRMERGAAVDNAYEGGAVTVQDELTLTPSGS